MGDGARRCPDLAELEQLAEQLSQSYAGATMDDVDLDALARQLGDEAAVDARTLAELERALLNQGFLDRGSDGQWRLSPKAMRQLGKAALRDVAQQLSGRHGERDTRRAGAAGELTGATRPWEFGDTEPWNVTRTITNAVLRRAGGQERSDPGMGGVLNNGRAAATRGRRRRGVRDRGPHPGRGRAAGRHLVLDGDGGPLGADEADGAGAEPTGQHAVPSDALQIIAFGRYARTVIAAELTGLEGVCEQGTNLHHALALAVRHLRRHPSAQPVVLVVTDGEPTAHLEDFDGQRIVRSSSTTRPTPGPSPTPCAGSTRWPGSGRR